MQRRCIKAVMLAVMLVLLINTGCASGKEEDTDPYNIISCSILKLSEEEWLTVSGDALSCGRQGDGDAAESISFGLSNPAVGGSLQYQGYLQKTGWSDWIKEGDCLGEKGSGKGISALKLQLTEKMAEQFHIYYRVYISDMGWSPWALDGQTAGMELDEKGIEVVEVKLISLNGIAPSDGKVYEIWESTVIVPNINYSICMSDAGWLDCNEGFAGNPDSASYAEGFKADISGDKYTGSVEYRIYSPDTGWHDWAGDGSYSGGTEGTGRAEGIEIRLTGEVSEYIDVYYRVYIDRYGWLGWAMNGRPAGSRGLDAGIKAVQIIATQKGMEAPGDTVRASISGICDYELDTEQILKNHREKMITAGKYFVMDTAAFKEQYGSFKEKDLYSDKSGDLYDNIKTYSEQYLYSELVEVDLSQAKDDLNDFCVQKLLEFYIDKGTKTIFNMEFVGYTMDNRPIFKCYFSRS